ncbi:PREDICTED: sarcoplasmic reticulum histidine-rich calcium-binding protein-like [Ceratosolen solmsi marchali]|uniref:Sarcoplasmic reticulum histidine-rich calcium-binding protein-like n=1 Tax=Ceratosolen solmsi marchali TaxID=326594 RepID=A0AAJ6YPW2_9HYME|nr:PREDICTED: sarcoplasmic reticulum histidine-rich calcium-binding protein-like [Ceratosolen solmsi marchali]
MRTTRSFRPRLLLLLITILVSATIDDCDAATARKYYSEPLSFRYSREDQEISGTEHEDKHRNKGDDNHETGAALEHDEDSRANKADDAHKGYNSYKKLDKKDKQHVDRKTNENHFQNEKQHEGEKHDDAKHYKYREKSTKENESAEFDEEGDHQKGHSTKGEHNIFKKDEYEKKHDFYDEFYDDDGEEEHGNHHQHHKGNSDGHHKSGHDIGEKHERKKGGTEAHKHEHRHYEHEKHGEKERNVEDLANHKEHDAGVAYGYGKKWAYKSV